MNDIDILEELKNKQYTNKDILGDLVLSEEEYTAISTLISENKELKEERDMYRSQVNSAFKNGFIHKSKVEELRVKIYKVLDVNAITRAYQLYIDNEFKNILGKE